MYTLFYWFSLKKETNIQNGQGNTVHNFMNKDDLIRGITETYTGLKSCGQINIYQIYE